MQGVPASDGVTDPPMTISSGDCLTSPRAPLSHAPIPMSKAMESPLLDSSCIAGTIPSMRLWPGSSTTGRDVIADRATATRTSGCLSPSTV